jgi:hypothetical protein
MHALRAQERAARVDLVHQVVALHRRLERAGERDGAGVVHEDVDATEGLDGLGDGGVDRRVLADVHGDRERLAARLLHVLGCRVDRARQLRVRLGRLGDDHDVRAVLGGAEADGVSDAAARAGDEERLAFQAHLSGLLERERRAATVPRVHAETRGARGASGAMEMLGASSAGEAVTRR